MGRQLRELEKKSKTILWKTLGRLARKRRPVPASSVDVEKIKSILVIRPDRLGDVVLSTPVYESIKRSLPKSRLTVLVDRAQAGILADNPFIDDLLELDRKKPWRAAAKLLRGKYDLALTLNKMFSATASMLTFLSAAKYRVGYTHPQNTWVHNVQISITEEPRHETQNNLELLRHLGLREISDRPQLYFAGACTPPAMARMAPIIKPYTKNLRAVFAGKENVPCTQTNVWTR